MIRKVAMECLIGQVVTSTKENISKIYVMVMDKCSGLMDHVTRVVGRGVFSMDKA